MAGFDDEVGEDFVEGGDGVGEGWGVVAEGYEEGGDWSFVLEIFLVEWLLEWWWTYGRLS